jgi:hypothetical protein
MFDAASDVLKLALAALAVFLPAIAAYFMYKKEQVKKEEERKGQIGPGLVAIGGALANQHDTLEYVAALREHTAAIKEQTACAREETARAKGQGQTLVDILDELQQMRRAAQELNHIKKNIAQSQMRVGS